MKNSTRHVCDLTTRTYQVRLDSLDEKTRSVEAVIATEAMVTVFDWNQFRVVYEVLLMSGCRIPANRQVPMQDTHDSSTVQKQLGSTRELHVEGDKLIGRNYFSNSNAAEHAWILTREGHLKDNSIGYRITKTGSVIIEAGQTAEVEGRSFTAPPDRDLRVVTEWEVKENSVCPIGADDAAKNRTLKGNFMNFETWLQSQGFERESLSEKQLASLQAAYDAGQGRMAPAVATAEDEKKRVAAIRKLGGDDVPAEIIERCITEDKTVGEAKVMVLDAIRSNRPNVSAPAGIEVGDNLLRANLPAAISDAILTRADVPLLKEDAHGDIALDDNGRPEYRKPHEASRQLMHARIPDMARQLLLANGSSDAMGLSDRQVILTAIRMDPKFEAYNQRQRGRRAAASTYTLPEILGNSMNKSLMASYYEYPTQWPKFCRKETHNNFQEITQARLGELENIAQIGPGGEYSYGTVGEEAEKYTLAKYGKIFGITMESLLNDNLRVFNQVPRKLGQTTRRIEDVLAFAVLTLNAAMGDGVAIFHADHGNFGAGAAISITSLNAARLAFRKQKGKTDDDVYLNIVPAVLIIPPDTEGTAETLLKSEFDPADQYHKKANIWRNKLELCVHPILSASSTAVWYLSAAPSQGGIVMCFLNSAQQPQLEREVGFENDTLRWKIRHIVAAKCIDYRALYKNPGA